MKKILLGLAAVTTVTAPLATVYVMNPNEKVATGTGDSVSSPPFDFDQEKQSLKDSFDVNGYAIDKFYSDTPKETMSSWSELTTFLGTTPFPSTITNSWKVTNTSINDGVIIVDFSHIEQMVPHSLNVGISFKEEVSTDKTEVTSIIKDLNASKVSILDSKLSSSTTLENLSIDDFDNLNLWKVTSESFDVENLEMTLQFEHRENSNKSFEDSFAIVPLHTITSEDLDLILTDLDFTNLPTMKEQESYNPSMNLIEDLNFLGETSKELYNLEEKITNTENLNYLGYQVIESTLVFDFDSTSVNIEGVVWKPEEIINIEGLQQIQTVLNDMNLSSKPFISPDSINDQDSLISSSIEHIDLTPLHTALIGTNFSLTKVFGKTANSTNTLHFVLQYNSESTIFSHEILFNLNNVYSSWFEFYEANLVVPELSAPLQSHSGSGTPPSFEDSKDLYWSLCHKLFLYDIEPLIRQLDTFVTKYDIDFIVKHTPSKTSLIFNSNNGWTHSIDLNISFS